jgi:hypothetical protein
MQSREFPRTIAFDERSVAKYRGRYAGRDACFALILA